jgi:hypothetical protein
MESSAAGNESLDPDIRERLALAAEEQLAASVASAIEIKPIAKVEKGFLFSAPCMEMNRDGELKTEQK